MKVLFIVSRLHMGGIENMLLNLIRYFKGNDFEIHILCNLGGELDEQFLSLGAKLHKKKYKSNPINDVRSLFYLLKREDFDLIHSQLSHTSGFLALIANVFRIPFFISVHNQKSTFKLNWQNNVFLNMFRKMYLFLHRILSIKFSEKIIGHSKANLIYYNKNWEAKDNKYKVVENGIDFLKLDTGLDLLTLDKKNKLEFFCKDAEITLIHIGKFKDQKNHKFLIDIFKEINPIENKYKLILIGSGVLLDKTKEKVSNLGLTDNVLFTGMETNIAPYLNKSNIFLFPSLYEGFGNVLIEAQYKNLSICASDLIPHYESVYFEFHKYFFNPERINDAVVRLTQCIVDINAGKHKKVREKASLFSKKFSIENMSKKMISLYKNLSKEEQ